MENTKKNTVENQAITLDADLNEKVERNIRDAWNKSHPDDPWDYVEEYGSNEDPFKVEK